MSAANILRQLFTRRDRVTLVLLALLMVVSGLLEVFGIGMLFPYISVLQNPTKIADTWYLSVIYNWLGFGSYRSFVVAMSVSLLVTFCAKGFFTLWVTNSQLAFVNAKLADLGSKLLSGYLHRPYSFFLTTNTSALIGNLTTSVTQLCTIVFQSALSLLSEAVVFVGVIVLLVYLSPTFSLSAMLFFGGLSLLYRRVIKARIQRYSLANDHHWKAMIRSVNEGLSSAKDVRALGCQQYFIDTYSADVKKYGRAVRSYSLLLQLPRVALETAAVAGMVIFAVFAVITGKFEKELFAVLAVFALATVRVVPSATRMLQAWNAVSFYSPSIGIVAAGISEGEVESSNENTAGNPSPASRMDLGQTLVVSIKSFAYPTNPHFHLAEIDLTIRRGQTVGLIGHSGSGKTTLVDLILGFFPQFDGSISVDGHDIRENLTGWRQQIGYIPQSIYLRDDTIARNVAFGIPDSRIDMREVERAICLAGLESVVRTQRDGLETMVGDRGIRLSGGERQRIGIARALYHDPDLLILDEATSALDNETERQIVDAILALSPAKTVIVIAHRLSTVKHCDIVYLLRGGRIIGRGPFSTITELRPDLVSHEYASNAVLRK